jgi:hypothetical protein
MRTSLAAFLVLLFSSLAAAADALPVVTDVEAQPLKAQVKRIVEALDFLGQPLTDEQKKKLDAALAEKEDLAAVKGIQAALDPLCIAGVNINPESRVKASRGEAKAKLMQHGWTVFLVKVQNDAGITASLRCNSPNAAPLYKQSSGSPDPKPSVKPADVPERWLDLITFDQQPLNKALSGLAVEYRIISLYSRVSGKREAKLAFDVGQGTQDLGFRNELNILFEIAPAVRVKLDVLDDDGTPTTGNFVFKDAEGRIYPARSRRLEPDLFFHDQIYRADGEEVFLAPGKYEVAYGRGPEYLILKKTITVPNKEEHLESFRLKRWINLAKEGWHSGDHHVHAAGCAHYEAPTQGVTPEAMMRHIQGEDLNVGCVLSWGPCWYYQKQFFEGKTNKLSVPNYLMRYDVEVSGFPSQHCGHLCLLRLKEDDYKYPSDVEFDWKFGAESGHFKGRQTEKIGEWPTWDLPILKWGQEQGGVVGFSHSGWGLQVPGDQLPSYEMPKFDGIGANEYVVDVVHNACDFISSVDTPIIWELSVWYHTLNCGYQCRISGETDFPCIYGEKVGLGRAYVKLPKGEKFNFDTWVSALKDGRSYCCDGLSHLYDFEVNGLAVGEKDAGGKNSVLGVKAGEKLNIKVSAAALLEEKPRDDIRNKPLDQKPYWHVERARVGTSNKVPVELIVNGKAVAKTEIAADGEVNDLKFDYTPERSSWVALRIFPSSHTNPVFVEVDNKPIRASQKSAQWCLDAVDVCWNAKVNGIRASERDAAKAAYDVARKEYKKILEESAKD